MKSASRIVPLVFVATLGTAVAAGAADAPRTPDTSLLPAADGAALYVEYCAVCHGAEGRGDGPMARGLTVSPTNLRRLAVSNGSEFPATRVRASIDGREQPVAHGPREMPLWGEVFKRTQGPYGERRVEERLDALVEYVRRLQER